MRRVWFAASAIAVAWAGACANGSLLEEDASTPDSSVPDAAKDATSPSDGGAKDVIVPTEAGCPSGTKLCGSICADTQNDPGHCGTCTTVCPPPEGGVATCTLGTCGSDCGDGGLSLCNTQCVDENNDTNHCGDCTTTCNGAPCNAGTCCAPGEVICSGQCTNTLTSIAHCGSCTNACDAGTCVNGACQAGTSYKVGDYTAYNAQGSFGPNYLLGEQLTVSQQATLLDFGLISKGSGQHVVMALYTDKNGAPNTLVAYTSSTVVSATDQQITPNTQASLSPGTYWIMAVYDVTGGPAQDSVTTNKIDYISFTFGTTLPTTFPTPTAYTNQDFNYYLVVQ